jgi:NADPH:quinone reductase-like Zn-dependent oxidoreductase
LETFAPSSHCYEEVSMDVGIPETMNAAVIDRYGGPEVLHLRSLPVPEPKRDEVLIRLDAAGIGVWDPWIRSGEARDELGERPFPQVLGNDGAGTVVAFGDDVTRFAPGDRVYAYAMEGGFYAEYVSVKEDYVAPIPRGLDPEEAGALGADGITALRGLEDWIRLEAGEKLLVIGASGGIGHLAVQLAKRKGAAVLAVASGPDGAALARRLGADVAIDGRRDDVARAVRAFAPEGLDGALVLVGSDAIDEALRQMKPTGRIAYPNGVEPEPNGPPGVKTESYDGVPTREAFARLNRLIEPGPFHVELGRVYRLAEASAAHSEIGKHHLGKLAFRVRDA